MSDLLNSASLVMIPSGYKEDVVYSAVPTDGSGDLSFTRASNGTRINSAGLVEVTPWNMVEYSEQIDNGAWIKSGAIITANDATAPNGTLTADKVVFAGSGNYFYQQTSFIGQATASIYVKGTAGQTISIDNTQAITEPLITLTGEWQRITTTTTTSGTAVQGLALSTLQSATARTIYVWGGQVNIGSTAKPYFPTTDRLNVPRLTYQNGGGGCPSLLLEKQSTNLILWSEDFTNGAWSKDTLTIGSNVTTSPDGTQNADNLIPTTSNGFHYALQAITFSAGANTISCYAKSSGYDWLVLDLGVTSAYAYFNVNTGVVGVTGSGATASIQSVGNGWYRCIVTFTLVSSGSYVLVSVRNADNGGQFVGNGTSGIYLWGAQLE